MVRITDEMQYAMQGIIPSMLVTASKEGEPNIAYISQVYYVDDTHVALSHQFFNKSIRNLQENPQIAVNIVDPVNLFAWRLDLVYSHTETEGETFEKMRAQLEAIASMMGMESVFELKAAEIFTIVDGGKIA
jgi:predicted pyridoxine 5'-phosphate oxidase superfamily flavin-nucleotide-binding protein